MSLLSNHQTESAPPASITELVDIDVLRSLLERFHAATGFTAGLVSYPDQELILKIGWRTICTEFHRACPASAAHCHASNVALTSQLQQAPDFAISKCGCGLVDMCTPIMVDGLHIASLCTGQLLFEPPDLERFRAQGEQFGYDVEAYLAALNHVPVIPEERCKEVLLFLRELAGTIADLGHTRLQEQRKASDLSLAMEKLRDSREELWLKQQIADILLNANEDEIFTGVRDIALRALSSPIGNFCYIDAAERLACPSADSDECSMCQTSDGQYCHPSKTVNELYQRTLAEKRTQIATEPLRSPEGLDIQRALLTPVIHDNQNLGLLTVANKAGDYTETDQHRIEMIAEYVAPFLKSRLEHQKTEQKRDAAEEALRESEHRFRTLFEQAGDAIMLVDPGTGAFVEFNQRAYESLGYTREEFTKLRIEDIEARESFQQIYGRMPEILTGKAKHFETMHRCKNGDLHDVDINPATMNFGGRKLVLAICRDITECKGHAVAIQRNEERYRLLADNTDDIVSLTKAEGSYSYISPSAERLTGWSQAEINASPWQSFVHPADVEPLSQAYSENLRGTRTQIEYRLRRKDGEYIWLDMRAIPIADANGDVIHVLRSSRDITARKRAELALQREQQIFTGGSTVVFRCEGTEPWPVEYLSPNVKETLGYSVEDFLSQRITYNDILHADDFQRVMDQIRDHTQAGDTSFETKFRIKHAAGDTRWLHAFVVIIRDESNRVTHLEGYALDITDLKRIETAWETVERATARVSGQNLFKTVVVNLAKSLGVSYAMIGELDEKDPGKIRMLARWPDGQPGELADYELLGTPCEQTIRDGIFSQSVDVVRDFPDDRALESLAIKCYLGVRMVDSRGKPLGLVVIMHNDEKEELLDYTAIICVVADRVAAEIERMRSEEIREQLAAAINQAAEAVMVTDHTGTIQYINSAYERMTGYTCDDILHFNPRHKKAGDPTNAFYDRLGKTIAAGTAWSGRFVNSRKDGSLYYEDATISPVRNAHGEIQSFVAVKRDVTREVQLEEQVREAQKLDAVGQLAGGVAHDFNNILTTIIGNVELSLNDLKSHLAPDHNLLNALQQIELSAQRASTLTRQLLTFSRREAIQPQVISPEQVLTDLENMLRRLIREDIHLETILRSDQSRILIDRGQLEQVIVNLVVNAVDAMPSGGRLTIRTSTESIDSSQENISPDACPGRYVVLSIQDSGCGMDVATRERIFEPFFTTKDASKGTGLGLATVYGIIKQIGGFIDVESEPAAGTTMRIYLPVTDKTQAEPGDTPPSQSPAGGQESILVCEDDPLVRDLLKLSLESAGYTVHAFGQAQDALAFAQDQPRVIDLLLTDVIMPNLNGKQLADRIHETLPDLATLFISGYASNVIAEFGAEIKDADLIQKPFNREQLLLRVRSVLDRVSTR
jgi:two-component system cell cycle sensor histidine kinase/response regulator CckA